MTRTITRETLRPYLPLVGFVVPTLVMGYGVVIPRSCIAGLNELSIGFGTTVLGAAFTYVAGQRAVRQNCARKKRPWSVRIARAINRQAASPSGWFGRLLGFVWPREHGRLNAEVLDRLHIEPGHRVLEIGCGTGHALSEAARRAGEAAVVGVDISELMVGLARSRNRVAIARGNVDVHVADVASLAPGPSSFDRMFSVQSIYFWRDVKSTLVKLAAALRPNGKLVLAFRPEGDGVPARFRDDIYRFPRTEDIESALTAAGLAVRAAEPSSSEPGVIIVTALRP